MKTELEIFAGVDLTDARTTVRLDSRGRALHVNFTGASDAVLRTYVEGWLCLNGWQHVSVEVSGLNAEPETNPSEIPEIDRICEHETFGDSLVVRGFTVEGPWAEWKFNGFTDFQIEITRRYVWKEEEDGGRAADVPLRDSPPAIGEARVMIETPDTGRSELDYTYARRCLADSRKRGEYSFFPTVLERALTGDSGSEELSERIEKSRDAWADVAEATIVYTDFGTTPRMRSNELDASHRGRSLRYRRLFEPEEAQRFMEVGEAEN